MYVVIDVENRELGQTHTARNLAKGRPTSSRNIYIYIYRLIPTAQRKKALAPLSRFASSCVCCGANEYQSPDRARATTQETTIEEQTRRLKAQQSKEDEKKRLGTPNFPTTNIYM